MSTYISKIYLIYDKAYNNIYDADTNPDTVLYENLTIYSGDTLVFQGDTIQSAWEYEYNGELTITCDNGTFTQKGDDFIFTQNSDAKELIVDMGDAVVTTTDTGKSNGTPISMKCVMLTYKGVDYRCELNYVYKDNDDGLYHIILPTEAVTIGLYGATYAYNFTTEQWVLTDDSSTWGYYPNHITLGNKSSYSVEYVEATDARYQGKYQATTITGGFSYPDITVEQNENTNDMILIRRLVPHTERTTNRYIGAVKTSSRDIYTISKSKISNS